MLRKVPRGCVYAMCNRYDGKMYIGQTTDLALRKKNHLYALWTHTHPNKFVQEAYDTYGEKCFLFHILGRYPDVALGDMERHFISLHKTTERDFGYNIYAGGKAITPETRKRMSNSRRKLLGLEEYGEAELERSYPVVEMVLIKDPVDIDFRKPPKSMSRVAVHYLQRLAKAHSIQDRFFVELREPSDATSLKELRELGYAQLIKYANFK